MLRHAPNCMTFLSYKSHHLNITLTTQDLCHWKSVQYRSGLNEFCPEFLVTIGLMFYFIFKMFLLKAVSWDSSGE
jgi:hypothetical protein